MALLVHVRHSALLVDNLTDQTALLAPLLALRQDQPEGPSPFFRLAACRSFMWNDHTALAPPCRTKNGLGSAISDSVNRPGRGDSVHLWLTTSNTRKPAQ